MSDFYVFGLMRSGTNAFCKYAEKLNLNCVNDPLKNRDFDYNSYEFALPPVGWKHSFPSLMSESTPIIICLKDAFSQYASLRKVWKKYGAQHHFSHAYKQAYSITKSLDDFIELYKKYFNISKKLSEVNENVHLVFHDEFCKNPEKYYEKIFNIKIELFDKLTRIDPGLNETNELFDGKKSRDTNYQYIRKNEKEKLENLNEQIGFCNNSTL